MSANQLVLTSAGASEDAILTYLKRVFNGLASPWFSMKSRNQIVVDLTISHNIFGLKKIELRVCRLIDPLNAKLFRGNINIHLHFMSLLNVDRTQIFEILPHVRQGPTHST